MHLVKLRLSIIGTLALIIGMSTLFFTFILTLLGVFNILFLAIFVVFINVIQWLLAPYLINAIYKVKEASSPKHSKLCEMVERLSRKMRLKPPQLMIANIAIPNAFAYGSPLTGNRVAVTTGLLKELEDEEVEAVIGHELGHLKHRDVQIMMFASVLPAIFYFIGFSLMLSGMFGGGRRRDEAGYGVLIGIICMAIYWILTLFVLGLSRLREYYADQRSVVTVEDGSRKLSEGLAKIVSSSSRLGLRRKTKMQKNQNSFKSLFIADPDSAAKSEVEIAQTKVFKTDQKLVEDVLARKITTTDRILELFSTHPNIVKRLRALQRLS